MVAETTETIGNWPQTVEEFARLVELTQHELVQFAAYRLGNQSDAEDAVQDVYVQAFRDRVERSHISEVRAYLFRMVRNRCTDALRARSRMVHGVDTSLQENISDAFRSMAACEQARRIEGLLARIPEREAEVIQLRAWAGLSFAEVSAAVGASVPTVKSRFRYGVEKLQRLLHCTQLK